MSSQPIVYLVTFAVEGFLQPDGRPIFPPVATLYLATALREAGFEPRVLHLLPDHLKQLEEWMKTERPVWVGFSVMSGAPLAPSLIASRMAKNLGIPVVWGGVHASMLPELSLADAADYVALGDGEETATELTTAIVEGKPTDGIAGLVSSTEEDVKWGPARGPVEDLDRYPPAWDFIDLSQYSYYGYPGRVAIPFIFSRGCPYRCRFCHNETTRAGRWRRHSDEYLDETLERFGRNIPFSVVNFSDDYLFEKPGKNTSWIELLARRGLKWTASIRAGALTPQFARWLEENGCIEIRIGMESGHPATLLSRTFIKPPARWPKLRSGR